MTISSRAGRLACLALLFAGSPQAATFIVDTTQNSNAPPYQSCDDLQDGDCSFHAALERANSTPELDTIAFDIPASEDSGCVAATGVCRIFLPETGCYNQATPFAVTEPVVIDGLTQPGAGANTLPADGAGVNMQVKIELARTGYCRRGLQFHKSATLRGVAVLQESPVGSQTFPFLHFLALSGDHVFRVESSILGGDASGASPLNTEVVLLNPILTEDCAQCPSSGTNTTHIGGPLPAQRNLFAAGGPGIRVRAYGGSAASPSVSAGIEGNLFGTGRTGMQNLPTANLEGWINTDLGDGGIVHIGGSAPSSRNVFGSGIYGAVRPSNLDVVSTTGAANLFIQGNYFGLGVDGVTPLEMTSVLNGYTQPVLDVARAHIGGAGAGESNLFVGLSAAVLINSRGANTILSNQFIGNIGYWILWDPARPQYGILNDAGDADSHPTHGRVQNWPQITAFSVTGDTLSLTYRVDSLPSNSLYPLTIEFYRGNRNNPESVVGRDLYTAAEAATSKTISIPLLPGHGMNSESVILATANNASDGGNSIVSWSPVYLTFQGNAPADLDTPTPITVRVQGLGPFRPRGVVEISDSYPNANAQICRATLVPSPGSPYRAEGTCNMTWSQPRDVVLTATYLDSFEAFHSDNGGSPAATRNLSVMQIDDSMFCDGFDSATGCNRHAILR